MTSTNWSAMWAMFFRRLRRETGGQAFAYVWVPEWHKSGHGLHVHFAVGRFIDRSLIERAWGHGFVHIKLLGDLPVGSGALGEARAAAGYLSKYVGKSFADSRVPGRNRYDVAQGFQPSIVPVWGASRAEAIREASLRMGGRQPSYVWHVRQCLGMAGAAGGVGAMAGLNDFDLAAFVEASCRRHGVPVKIRDVGVHRDVALLLSGRAVRGAAQRDPDRRADSESPDEINPLRVEDCRRGRRWVRSTAWSSTARTMACWRVRLSSDH